LGKHDVSFGNRFLDDSRQARSGHMLIVIRDRLAHFLIGVLLYLVIAILVRKAAAGDLSRVLNTYSSETVSLVSVFLLLLSLLVLPQLGRIARRLLHTRTVSSSDIIWTTVALLLARHAHLQQYPVPVTVLFATLSALPWIRFLSHRKRNHPIPRPLLPEILGPGGFGPLPDFRSERLNYAHVLDALYTLIHEGGQRSLTVGLNGVWGSGKTSVISELSKRLEAAGIPVITVDAWHFHDPSRLIFAYFDSVGRALIQLGFLPQSRINLFRLASALSDIKGLKPLMTLLTFRSFEEDVATLSRQIKKDLDTLTTPIVVLIDDLDRLSSDQVMAVLRVVAVVNGLSNIIHVVAYDRSHLDSLVPSHEGNRDFIGKVIHIEFPLSPPPRELLLDFINSRLAPYLALIGAERAESFNHQLSRIPPHVLTLWLDTPREIKRVIATCAWMWTRATRDINAFDLFILTILQYRFPKVYHELPRNPEWFIRQDWYDSKLYGFIFKDDWKRGREGFIENLKKGSDPGMVMALLQLIFPVEMGDRTRLEESEPEARAARRIMHPDVFYRYFQLGLVPNEIPESSVEDLAHAIARAGRPDRQRLLSDAIRKAIQIGSPRLFWSQWELFVSKLAPLSTDTAEDLIYGIADAVGSLDTSIGPLSLLREAGRRTIELCSQLDNDVVATSVLVEAVRRTTSFQFAGLLAFWTASRSYAELYGGKSPDARPIQEAFNERVRQFFVVERRPLLSADSSEYVPAIFWSSDYRLVNEMVLGELARNPKLILPLLRTSVQVIAENLIYAEELPALANRVDLHKANELSSQLDPDTLADEADRQVLLYFRRWLESQKLERTER
jgi:hypothetical protein